MQVSESVHYQPYSMIQTQLVYDGDGELRKTSFTGEMTSADRNTKVKFRFTYIGETPYVDATFDLRTANFTLPTTSGQYQYCFPTRTRATIGGDDPNLTMSLQAKEGRICLPLKSDRFWWPLFAGMLLTPKFFAGQRQRPRTTFDSNRSTN